MANKLSPVVVVSRDAAVTGVTSLNGFQGTVTGAEAGLAASGANGDITSLTALSGPLTLGANGVDDLDAVAMQQLDGLLDSPTVTGTLTATGAITSEKGNITAASGDLYTHLVTTPTPATGTTLYSGNIAAYADVESGVASEMLMFSEKTMGTSGVKARLITYDKLDTAVNTIWDFPATGKTMNVMGAGQYGWGGGLTYHTDDLFTFVLNNTEAQAVGLGVNSLLARSWADALILPHSISGDTAKYATILQIGDDGSLTTAVLDNSNGTATKLINIKDYSSTSEVSAIESNLNEKISKLGELVDLQAARIEAMEMESMLLKERLAVLEEMHDIVV